MEAPEGQACSPIRLPGPEGRPIRLPGPEGRPRARRRGGAAAPPKVPLYPRPRGPKRRALGSCGDSVLPLTSPTSERRNERERNRVKLVNQGFVHLRRHVPLAQGASKKLSKVETLRSAVDYIRELQGLLGELGAPPGEGPATSDGLSPHSSGSSSADSLPLSPGSSALSLEEASQDSRTIADYLTMHSWG